MCFNYRMNKTKFYKLKKEVSKIDIDNLIGSIRCSSKHHPECTGYVEEEGSGMSMIGYIDPNNPEK